MFAFGKRKITKQGGSYLISLPMQWMVDNGLNLKQVSIGMDSDKTLRIAPIPNANPESVHANDLVKGALA